MRVFSSLKTSPLGLSHAASWALTCSAVSQHETAGSGFCR
jgi:hypothetical protein